MNREWKRQQKRDKESKDRLSQQMMRVPGQGPKKERAKPKQYVREIVAELKRVNWPSRAEVTTYSVVVLVVVLLMVGLVFVFDLAFAKAIFALFKPPTVAGS